MVWFTTAQIEERSGLTVRQLQWLRERRIAPHTRTERGCHLYSERDAFKVLLIAAMRRAGISLWKIRKILRKLPEEPGHLLVVTDHAEFFGSREAAIFALVDAAGGGVVIDLAELVDRLFGRETKPKKTLVQRRPAPPPHDYELTTRELDRMYRNSLRDD